LTDHTCILKTSVFTQRWYGIINLVVFIIKSLDLAYSVTFTISFTISGSQWGKYAIGQVLVVLYQI